MSALRLHSLTYRTAFESEGDGYVGLYALPGDQYFRECRRKDKTIVVCETAHEAEALAGHRLVSALNDLLPVGRP